MTTLKKFLSLFVVTVLDPDAANIIKMNWLCFELGIGD
jgi:hypothetical protein